MADAGLLVTISGSALSLLLYENVRSTGDQLGFLLGETVTYVIKKFTDFDHKTESVEIHVNIQTVVTCPSYNILQDSCGTINKDVINNFLKDKKQQVVGWFRYRQNASLLMTFKDKILHKQFSKYFTQFNNSKEENFLTCLLTSSLNTTRGTHKFKHLFLRCRNSSYISVQLKIHNLGHDASRHDGSDYKISPAMKSSDEVDILQRIISPKLLEVRTSGVNPAMIIHDRAEKYLRTLIPRVTESERKVAELKKQFQDLHKKIMNRKRRNMTALNSSFRDTESDQNTSICDTDVADLENEINKTSNKNSKVVEDLSLSNSRSTSHNQKIISNKRWNAPAHGAKSVSHERMRKTQQNISIHKMDINVNSIGTKTADGRQLNKLSSKTKKEKNTLSIRNTIEKPSEKKSTEENNIEEICFE